MKSLMQAGGLVQLYGDSLSRPQKSRSTRLFSILKAAFSSHPRTNMIIAAFSEGLNVQGNPPGMSLMTEGELKSNGYELLRQLTQEFSLRSRAEALSLRTSLAAKSFSLSPNETTVSTVVSDTIRKLDFECNRYMRLLSTLPRHVDSTGLNLSESDMLMILLRSLPNSVRDFCLHHSVGETFQDYKRSARRWEEQQRLFQELYGNQQHGRKVNQVVAEGGQATEWHTFDDEEGVELNAVVGDKCSKCGSKKHSTDSCSVDLSKVKCFSCGLPGHIGANCPKKSQQDGKGYSKSKGDKGKGKYGGGKGVVKGHFDKGKNKGKGKKGKPSKGFGKKGKLNEVAMSDEDWWWHQDDWGWSDSSWNVDNVGWYGSDWEGSWGWYGETGSSVAPEHAETETNTETKHENQPAQTVGSLILHAVSGKPCFGIGNLTLEDSVLDGADLNSFGVKPSPRRVLGERSWFCGLKSKHDWHFEEDPCFHEGLLVQDVRQSDDALDVFSKFHKHGCHDLFFFSPLLSELGLENDVDWWLIDSGAAVTVVSEAVFGRFGSSMQSSPDCDRFRAANGSKVVMKGVADITLNVVMFDEKKQCTLVKKASMKAMIGNTNHNIISTTSLCQSGWSFSQWADGAELRHVESGLKVDAVVMHAGCPWIRMTPVKSGDVDVAQPKVSMVRFDVPDVERLGVNPLSPAVEAQLEAHRQQGHFPHHPQCIECAKGRAVFQHRRKKHNAVECEVQADFAFISHRGEVTELDSGKNIKVLVMTELLSGCVAFVVVSENKSQVQSLIERWLDSFGLVSQQTSIILHTDDEVSVGELVGRSSRHYLFQIRRAAPQQHRSIGGAERSVRKLKESLAVLRSDLNRQGYDVRYSYEGLRDVVTYLALMSNHFGRVGGTNLSPLETSAGRALSKPTVSLFGSVVIAEIPDSIRQYSPNETRSIEACYLHPGLGTGAAVEGVLRVQGQMQLRRFYARNVRQGVAVDLEARVVSVCFDPLGGP